MSESKRTVKVEVLGEDKGASKALKGVSDAADKVGPSGKVASNALDSVTSALTSGLGPAAGPAKDALDKVGASAMSSGGMLKMALAGGAVVGGLALAKFAADGVAAATSLAESTSKSRQVFGPLSADVEKFGDTAARSLGMSKQAAIEAAGTFGNLFTAMGMGVPEAAEMSKGLVTLAADLASFNNLDPTEVLEKLRSGLVGEVEPLRALGVNFNAAEVEAKAFQMGLANASGELDDSAKVQARYALILEKTKTAQGDFARTSDGLANQQRILKAQISDLSAEVGGALIPVLTQLGNIVIPVISGISDLAEKIGGVGKVASGVATAMLPVLSVLDFLPGKNKKAADSSDEQAKATAGLGKELDAAGVSLDGAAGKTVDLAKETKKAQAEADKYADKINAMASTVGSAYSAMGGKSKELTDKQRDLARGFDTAKSSADQLKQGLDILVGVKIGATRAAMAWEEKLHSTSHALRENKATLNITTEAGRQNTTAILDMVQAGFAHVEALQREGASSEAVTAAYGDHVEALRNVMRQAGYSEAQINALLQQYNLLAAAPDINKRITTVHEAVYVQRGDRTYGGDSTAGISQYALGMEMGPIPGDRNEMVPILAHGGEWVVTPEQMQRLRSAGSAGSDGAWAYAGGGGVSIAPGAIIIYALDPKQAALGVRDELVRYSKRVPGLGLD